MAHGPVGMAQGPVGMAQGPVGMAQGPVGVAQGPVGPVDPPSPSRSQRHNAGVPTVVRRGPVRDQPGLYAVQLLARVRPCQYHGGTAFGQLA
jgi:hypothetical protein